MINSKFNYYAIPLAIVSLVVFVSFLDKRTENFFDSGSANNELNSNQNLAMVIGANEISNDYLPQLGKSLVGFKEAVAFKESRGDYFTVNTFGYLGKYQFGKETLKMIGIYNPTVFLNSPALQERAFLANLERNKWILRTDIKRFDGKIVAGVKVTESGILAAAHLAGPGNVKNFLRSYGKTNVADAYGTTVTYYMKKFEGYDTSSIVPNRRAKARL